MSDPIVGIDLGTSTTVVAHADASGAVTVLADDTGARIVPSVLAFPAAGELLVGAAAKQRRALDPGNTVGSIKRVLGRGLASAEVASATRRMPYKIRMSADGRPVIATRRGDFDAAALAAILLDHAREIATRRLGAPVRRAVLAVPAAADEAARAALRSAAAMAGLPVVALVGEPIAAARAYAASRPGDGAGRVLAIYDFGAGAFDVTIIRQGASGAQVLGTAGDAGLGGDDVDERLVELLVQRLRDGHRLDLRTNPASMLRLRGLAEQTKIELSRRQRATVKLDDVTVEVARGDLERAIAALVARSFEVCDEALARAGIAASAIDDVVLVGGTTKLPYVREQVARHFGKPPRTDVSPEDAVARGAALHARAIAATLPAAEDAGPLPPIAERARPLAPPAAPASAPAAVDQDDDRTDYKVARKRAREEVFATPADRASTGAAGAGPATGALARMRLVQRPAGAPRATPPPGALRAAAAAARAGGADEVVTEVIEDPTSSAVIDPRTDPLPRLDDPPAD